MSRVSKKTPLSPSRLIILVRSVTSVSDGLPLSISSTDALTESREAVTDLSSEGSSATASTAAALRSLGQNFLNNSPEE